MIVGFGFHLVLQDGAGKVGRTFLGMIGLLRENTSRKDEKEANRDGGPVYHRKWGDTNRQSGCLECFKENKRVSSKGETRRARVNLSLAVNLIGVARIEEKTPLKCPLWN